MLAGMGFLAEVGDSDQILYHIKIHMPKVFECLSVSLCSSAIPWDSEYLNSASGNLLKTPLGKSKHPLIVFL